MATAEERTGDIVTPSCPPPGMADQVSPCFFCGARLTSDETKTAEELACCDLCFVEGVWIY